MQNKRFRSLGFKTTMISVVGMIFCVGIFLISQIVFGSIIDNFYMSESRISERKSLLIRELSKYINQNGISVSDKQQIRKWCEKHKYVYLSIYDGSTLLYETDGTMTNTNNSDTFLLYSDEDTPTNTAGYSQVEFSDGIYNVDIIEFTEQKFYSIIGWVGLFTSMLCYIIIIAAYNRHTVHRVVRLSERLKETNEKNLTNHIICSGNDEIAALGTSAEEMRNSIIKHYKSEQDAWDANKELLTSISHDIRTPLTSLLVYSEALKKGDVDDKELIKKYATVCNNKAIQLKELTDSMFRYFLVYGQKNGDCNIDTFEASDIIPQMLYEPVFYLQQLGFIINLPILENNCRITTDTSLLKRVIDNVFSNVKKYARKDKPVSVCLSNNDMLKISVINYIEYENRKSESTKIGLKSCEKAMELTNGRFYYSEQKGVFVVEISIACE